MTGHSCRHCGSISDPLYALLCTALLCSGCSPPLVVFFSSASWHHSHSRTTALAITTTFDLNHHVHGNCALHKAALEETCEMLGFDVSRSLYRATDINMFCCLAHCARLYAHHSLHTHSPTHTAVRCRYVWWSTLRPPQCAPRSGAASPTRSASPQPRDICTGGNCRRPLWPTRPTCRRTTWRSKAEHCSMQIARKLEHATVQSTKF